MIKQAIIPLAGLGTRLLPLTSVFAKELLPINGKPGLEYIIEECIEAGIKEIVFIISKKKLMIKKYFYNDKFYKDIIKKKNDPKIIKEYKKILKYKKMIKFVFQNKPLGTGDAVLKTSKFIKDKYERHKFIDQESNIDQIHHIIEFAKVNSKERTFEVLLQLFGQNFNLLAPIPHDVSIKSNYIQFIIDSIK